MKALITDMRHASSVEEEKVLVPAGIEVDKTFSETEDDHIRNGKGAVGFLVSYAKITRRVMEALPELKIMVKYGIGVDNMDCAAATDLGKFVVNVPDYCTEEVALHALALILDGLRQIPYFSGVVKSGGWETDPEPLIVYRPSMLALGLVGFGRIARLLAKYMEPMVREILYFDPFLPEGPAPSPKYRRVKDPAELFASCTILSLHAPLGEGTRGMVGEKLLSLARNAILVNTSRGGLVEKGAVLAAMERGNVGFFGSDVFWQEPPDRNDPETKAILGHPRAHLTPHVAWCSAESAKQVRRCAAEEVLRVARGELPRNVVNKDVLAKLGRT